MPSYQLTDEQAVILEARRNGVDMKVESGAGAGKTSTLRAIGEDRPSERGSYIAYNRAIANDAAASFPRNVECRTAHSYAYRAFGYKYKDRLDGPRLPTRVVAEKLGVKGAIELGGGKNIERFHVARLTMETIAHFCYSSDTTIKPRHVPRIPLLDDDQQSDLAKAIMRYTKRAWSDIQSANGELTFTPDYYLKMWAMSRPYLAGDYVLLDEAQDANPVIADVIDQQKHMQRILVGDANQAIYGWRGAVDAMSKFKGETFYLTQSFRFGPAIAEEANLWLAYLGATLRIRGFEKVNSVLTPVPEPDCVINRTNAGAMFEVIANYEKGKTVALVGGGDQIRRLAKAADDLKNGRRTEHPELFMFESWDELCEYTEEDAGGSDLKVFVSLVNRLGVPRILYVVNQLVEEKYADVIVSTAHKAKGREWPAVRVGEDFNVPEEQGEMISQEEARLAYVTVTRAKNLLDTGSLGWIRFAAPPTKEQRITDWLLSEAL